MKEKMMRMALMVMALCCMAGAYAKNFSTDTYDFVVISGSAKTVLLNRTNRSDLKVADIPSTVSDGTDTYTVIGIGATSFLGATTLTSVIIPETVTTIGVNAFGGCDAISSVTSRITKPFKCSPGFSDDVLAKATLYVPVGTIDLYKDCAPWYDFTNIEEKEMTASLTLPSATLPEAVYTLQGTRVEGAANTLPQGIYIVRRGDATSKILIK